MMRSIIELNELNSNDSPKNFAVVIRYANKSYGKSNVILSGLHMTIREGTIYGLLGPSGCGKTTLLNCILGRKKLDSGKIKVKARSVGDVGYMPQEIGLYKGFSIIETMTFYGKLFHLGSNEIEKRTDELLEFLQLPTKFRILASLSGGQIQRVSFAVALLHDPRLLILDEPTVGIDPLLCVKMWDRLLHMAENENKTVIVTTHYIEEARRAHTIGLMRHGKLLAEDSPSQLMIQYNCSTLEDVFLQMCLKQGTNTACQIYDDQINASAMYSVLENERTRVPMEQNFKCSKNVILALLMKNGYFIKRNVIIMIFFLLLPFANCVLYSVCVGNDPEELKIAVVNEEFLKISTCEWLHLKGCNLSAPLSCKYLNKLDREKYELVEYRNINQAKKSIKKNKVWGLIYFSKNYTASLMERMEITLKIKPGNISSTQSDIQIWLDESNLQIGNLMKKDILEAGAKFLQELFYDCGWPPRLADTPISMEKPIYGSSESTFRSFMAPGIIATFQFFLPQLFTMESVLMEKTTGSLDRSMISGVTIIEVAVSLMIIQFIVLCIQSTEMMVVLYVLYDNSQEGSLLWIILILFFTGASGMCFGYLLAVISPNDQTATFLGMGSMFVTLMLSGLMWPLEGMPKVLRAISYALPVTQCAEAFRAISVKDWTITDSTVYIGYISTFGWSCVYILVTSIMVKIKNGL